MTIALDRPTRTVRPAAASLRPAPQHPSFTAPSSRAPRPDAATQTVNVTLTIALPAGTADVEAARLADTLRSQALRLTAGRRARATVEVSSPHPFTSTTAGTPNAGSGAALRALPSASLPSAPARPTRDRRPGVVSPNSPARRDIENARRRTRQATAVSPAEPAQLGNASLVIDLYGRRVRIDGTDVDLTYKEFELLAHLARHSRRIVGREELLTSVWADADAETGERTVDVHIRRVRAKLGRYRRLISTVRGSGYRLDPGSDVAVLD